MRHQAEVTLHLIIEVDELEDGSFVASAQDFPLLACATSEASLDRQVSDLIELAGKELGRLSPREFLEFMKGRDISYEFRPPSRREAAPAHPVACLQPRKTIERTVAIHELTGRS